MESKGRLIIVAVAGVIVAFGAISIYKKMVHSDAPALVEKQDSNRVLIASRDLAAGAFLDINQDVDWKELKSDEIKDAYIREGFANVSSFNGAIIRRHLKSGDIVKQDVLMKSGEGGFMSAVLEVGHRAVSVSVNEISGNAGFISPGDKVDLIITRRLRMPNAGGGSDEQVISETFIENVRVLAVDQALDNPDNKAILAKTVTLEVTTKQAEEIAVAAELGRISLALRSMAVTPEQPVKKNALMNLYDGTSKKEHTPAISRIRIIRGDQVEYLEMQ